MCESSQHLRFGLIGRAVVDEDDFDRFVSLVERAFEREIEIGPVVVSDDNDGDEWTIFHRAFSFHGQTTRGSFYMLKASVQWNPLRVSRIEDWRHDEECDHFP